MTAFLGILFETAMLTASVAAMMLVLERLNVLTRGSVLDAVGGSRARQYLLAVLLGVAPGCMGVFAVVALYTDRRVSRGAVAAAMLASSGDEMFAMLSLFPGRAALIMAILSVLGILAGLATAAIFAPSPGGAHDDPGCKGFSLHGEECGDGHSHGQGGGPAGRSASVRALMALTMAAIAAVLVADMVVEGEPDVEGMVLLALMAIGLAIVLTAPAHFALDHAWKHVAAQHVPRVFLWTLAAFAAVALLQRFTDLEAVVGAHPRALLVISSLAGMIPQSGPHLVFTTLHAKGALPFSVLLANSAVQDGHGMLPLLAYSRMDYLKVKAVNLAIGLLAGAIVMAIGY